MRRGGSNHLVRRGAGTDKAAMSGDLPQTTEFMLATLAELYTAEVAAEEDVHRTLPFFATALGIVIGALGYAAGLMPPLPALENGRGVLAFGASALCLGMATADAGRVLYWLLRAVARRDHARIGPEDALCDRMAAARAEHEAGGTPPHLMDATLLDDMRQYLLDDYRAITPANRAINRSRHLFRANASTHLVRSLGWALAATIVIVLANKLAYLPGTLLPR